MKRIVAAFVITVLFLGGCTSSVEPLQPGLTLRERIINAKVCTFRAEICADFGDTQYTFALDCQTEEDDTLHFSVLSPSSISGISGYVDQQSGKLTFDETILTFPHLAEGEISPVCAPWLFYKALTGGYLRAAGKEDGKMRLTIDDSFQGENLIVEIWLDDGLPFCSEILWRGRRILTISFSDFRIL